MRHFNFAIMILFIGSSFAFGQRTCTVDAQLSWLEIENDALFQQFDRVLQQGQIRLRTDIILPVVVHVVYTTPENNISDAQILSQMEALNQAFKGHVNLSNDILPNHLEQVSAPNIQFQLACTDPNGMTTNGITRTQTTIPNQGFHFINGRYSIHHNEEGGVDPWPRDGYINIWVAEMEDEFLGRATLPILLSDPDQDGIVISTSNFGYLGTALDSRPYHLGRTLVHEMGHYLGLQHLWGIGGGSCGSDDNVDDTPNQSAIYYDCPSEQNSSSCSSSDMTKNFMGYVDDVCLQYFTTGQVNRMTSVLMSERSSLLESNAIGNCELFSQVPNDLLFWNLSEAREWVFQFPTIEPKIRAEIYNMAGQQVSYFEFRNTNLLNFSTSGFASGVYIIRFTYNDTFSQIKASIYQ